MKHRGYRMCFCQFCRRQTRSRHKSFRKELRTEANRLFRRTSKHAVYLFVVGASEDWDSGSVSAGYWD